jgi:hypothetical protein
MRSKPGGFDPLLDSLPRYAVLQLPAPERLHVVPGLLTSVRLCLIRGGETRALTAHVASCFERSNRERDEGCESQQLERDPRHSLTQRYRLSPSDGLASDPSMELPTYVVTYSTIAAKIRPLLADSHFVEVRWSKSLAAASTEYLTAELCSCRRRRLRTAT